MAKIVLTINTSDSSQNVRNALSFSSKNLKEFLKTFANFSNTSCSVQLQNGNAVSASATITIDNATIAANDTITIADITYTAKAVGAAGRQFNIGASSTETAANVATLLTSYSSTDFGGKLAAYSSAGVVTLTITDTGTVGNLVALAKNSADPAGITVSGSRFSGGVDESAASVSHVNF